MKFALGRCDVIFFLDIAKREQQGEIVKHVNFFSKIYNKFLEYMHRNNLKDVEFSYEDADNFVTIWCNEHLDDGGTKKHLFAVALKFGFGAWGRKWREHGETLPIKTTDGKEFIMPEWMNYLKNNGQQ